jgi:hypothetical protein
MKTATEDETAKHWRTELWRTRKDRFISGDDEMPPEYARKLVEENTETAAELNAELDNWLSLDEKQRVLVIYLDCLPEEVYSQEDDYLVYTDAEADEAAHEYIESSLWAFNASFILGETGINEGEESLQKMQEDSCEGCNEFIAALIKGTCGIEEFVQSAISADGRGHFMSSYDGEENEQGEFFIYRIN